jgi:adenine/guanine phosphoribosyltransferase-like PRPP-binding protein
LAAQRSPVAVTVAMNRDLQYRFRLATVIGLGAALGTWLLTGYLRFDGEDSLATAAAGGLAFGLVTAVAFVVPYLVPREWRVLETVFGVARRSARMRTDAYGDGRVPANAGQARSWLARHPDDTPETRGARVWAMLVLGDLEAARRLARAMPDATPLERYNGATARAMLRLVEGGDPELDDVRALAQELDEEGRAQAEIDVALAEALVLAADGGDWRGAILCARDGVEPAVGFVLVRWFLPVAALIAAGALAMTLVAYGFSLIVT